MWTPCAVRARACRGSRRCSKNIGIDATFYFSVGPDHTGRAMRRVFRKGFAQKVARTSVLKHYGLKTLMYGVLLPGPDIGRAGGRRHAPRARRRLRGGAAHLRSCALAGLCGRAIGGVDPRRVRARHECLRASVRRFPRVACGGRLADQCRMRLELEREYGLHYASDTRGPHAVLAAARAAGEAPARRLPTTLPTFDELLGRDGIDESTIADAVFRMSEPQGGAPPDHLQVFTLHAELEGMRLLGAFEALLTKWRERRRVAVAHGRDSRPRLASAMPDQRVIMGEVPGRSGLLAIQAEHGGGVIERVRLSARRALDGSRAGGVVAAAVAWRPWPAGRCSIPTKDATRKFRARCCAAAIG